MIGRSLRWRLLAAAGVAVSLALVTAWMLMLLLFERHLERRLASELENDGRRIVAGIVLSDSGALTIEDPPTDVRFQTPASGLYWQASHRSSVVRSPSLWDQALGSSPDATTQEWKTRIVEGPFQPRLILLERRVVPDADSDPVLVQIGQDADALEVAGAEFGRELGVFLALLWIFLAAATWVQVGLGLRPLMRIQGQLARLQGSPSERLDSDGMQEVQPLIAAINSLADAREADLERLRRRSTDLAHGLKTPLAALSTQARRARAAGADRAADGLDKAIAAMGDVVETELARTRLAAVRRDAGSSCGVAEVIEALVAVLERTEAGEKLVFDTLVDDGLRAPMVTEDLTELLGAIADNAVRFARRQVSFSGTLHNDVVTLCVEDDGPGIAPDSASMALLRGARLDESSDGQGLGLAIARDIIEATGGAVILLQSQLGGLHVQMCWPQSSIGPSASKSSV